MSLRSPHSQSSGAPAGKHSTLTMHYVFCFSHYYRGGRRTCRAAVFGCRLMSAITSNSQLRQYSYCDSTQTVVEAHLITHWKHFPLQDPSKLMALMQEIFSLTQNLCACFECLLWEILSDRYLWIQIEFLMRETPSTVAKIIFAKNRMKSQAKFTKLVLRLLPEGQTRSSIFLFLFMHGYG